MSIKAILAAGLALSVAACVTAPGGVAPPRGPAPIPSAPLDLGDWRHMSPDSALSAFQSTVSRRYAAGLALDDVAGDLRHNQFTCAPPGEGRGEPPAQVCRRTVTENGCTHTWQVHLFDTGGDAHLARLRELYDRRCGGDGLLGGPS